jgi:hypothetical protein
LAVVAVEQGLSDELDILGLAAPDEICAQAITPGWRVVLVVEGQQYVYRTDASGEVVRQEQ